MARRKLRLHPSPERWMKFFRNLRNEIKQIIANAKNNYISNRLQLAPSSARL